MDPGFVLPTPPVRDEIWSVATTGRLASGCQSRCYSELLQFDNIRCTPTPPLGRVPHGKYAADYRYLLERSGDAAVSKLTKDINKRRCLTERVLQPSPAFKQLDSSITERSIKGTTLQQQEAVTSDLTAILDRYKSHCSQGLDVMSSSAIKDLLKDTDRAGESFFHCKEPQLRRSIRSFHRPPIKPEQRLPKESICPYQAPRIAIAAKLQRLRCDEEAWTTFNSSCSQLVEQRKKTCDRKWIQINKKQCGTFHPGRRSALLSEYFNNRRVKHQQVRYRCNQTIEKDLSNKTALLYFSSCDGNRARKLLGIVGLFWSAREFHKLQKVIIREQEKLQERARLKAQHSEKVACSILCREIWRFILHLRICRKRKAVRCIINVLGNLSKKSALRRSISKYIKAVTLCQNRYKLRKIRYDARLMVWGLQWMRCENILRAEHQAGVGGGKSKKRTTPFNKSEDSSIDMHSLRRMVQFPSCPIELRNSVLSATHAEVIVEEKQRMSNYEADLTFYKIRMEQYQAVSFNVPEPERPLPPTLHVLLPKSRIMLLVSKTHQQLAASNHEKVRKNIAAVEPPLSGHPDWAGQSADSFRTSVS